MTVTDVDDPCPRVGCGAPYSHIIKTDEAFQQQTVNITAARCCYIPIMLDGKPAVAMVYHTYEDLASTEFDKPYWAEWREMDPDRGLHPGGPDELPANHNIVFEIIRSWTAEHGTILMRDLRPEAKGHGIGNDTLLQITLDLIYHEFVVELDDSVFKARAEVVV